MTFARQLAVNPYTQAKPGFYIPEVFRCSNGWTIHELNDPFSVFVDYSIIRHGITPVYAELPVLKRKDIRLFSLRSLGGIPQATLMMQDVDSRDWWGVGPYRTFATSQPIWLDGRQYLAIRTWGNNLDASRELLREWYHHRGGVSDNTAPNLCILSKKEMKTYKPMMSGTVGRTLILDDSTLEAGYYSVVAQNAEEVEYFLDTEDFQDVTVRHLANREEVEKIDAYLMTMWPGNEIYKVDGHTVSIHEFRQALKKEVSIVA